MASGLVMLLLCEVENALKNKKRVNRAEDIRTKDEQVLSYNATVLVNKKTQVLSWYDNDRIRIYKEHERT